jgi:hypothetical protein
VKATATPVHPVQFADGDSEELSQPIEDLRQRIAVIRGKLASEIVPKDIATSPPDTPSILGLDGEPVASAVDKITIPRKPTASLEAYDTTTIVLGRLGLLGGAIDESGTFTLGSITPALEATLRLSDKKEKIASFYGTLVNPSEDHDKCTDFLRRRVDQPNYDAPTIACFLNGWFSYTPCSDIAAISNKRFNWIFCGPDNRATLSLRTSNAEEVQLQEMCGEQTANISKLSTSITYNQSIWQLEPFLAWIANCCDTIEKSWTLSNPDNLLDTKNPFTFRVLRSIAIALTSRTASQFFKAGTEKPHRLFCWIFQTFDRISCLYHHPSSVLNYCIKAGQGTIEDNPALKFKQANNLANEMFEKLDGFFTGTDTIPNCVIATQLEHARAKRQLEEAQSKQAESKRIKAEKEELQRLRTEPGGTNGRNNTSGKGKDTDEDKSGPIIFKVGAMMPTVDEADPSKRLCAGHIRNGASCKGHKKGKCASIHNKDPMTWDLNILKAWLAKVEETQDMEWAPHIDVAALKTRAA